jgi:hypothetical protein
MNNSSGHGDDGKRVLVEDFDYDAIDSNLFQIDPEELAGLTQKEIDISLKLMDTVMRWIWQNGMRNLDGLQIRSMIACWIFIRELRPLTETQLAQIFGKDKQSVGRWVDEWKKSFPMIRTPHMKS